MPLFLKPFRPLHPSLRSSRGFTLIELMVVIGIIVLAAGLMTPTITDFFRNRQLENARGHFGSAFSKARLKAVTQRSRSSLVFFREGVRVYLDGRRRFDEEDLFNPETSPLADESIWFILGFQDKTPSFALPSYRVWEAHQKLLESEVVTQAKLRGARSTGKDEVSIAGLPRIIFERDGSLSFGTGTDVGSSASKEADITICQALNNTVCFIDLRLTGQMRSRMEPQSEAPVRPVVESKEIPSVEIPSVEGGASAEAESSAPEAGASEEAGDKQE